MASGAAGDAISLIGNTPMVKLSSIVPAGAADVYAKLEMFNPGGSVKDRIAMHMVEKAEEEGLLKPGGVIVEATSGNTGIGLAMVAAAKGYRLILVMPETMSRERQEILTAYGAELVLTPGQDGMKGSVDKAEEILAQNPGYYMPRQFENPANPEIHRLTTAREILEQIGGKVDAFVAGIGTGGTITGVGQVLKKEIPGVQIIGVEPAESPVLSGGQAGPHRIQGIGAGFVPKTLDVNVLDRVITIKDVDAYLTSVTLAREEGLLVGYSSGAAAAAAIQVARELGPGKKVVTIFPDTGERYLSMASYFRMDLQRRGIEL
ncbi:cysteine synthase A [Thermincola potens]|uniref:Cysteine synthase n=1 Tax=Thermincola potens (strain JR) TaxID=635013 RepID=D5X9I2_THEPJ|nr:cysteine synthase A [Thermincola potens]ADG83086.1 cysteine synthase A [Thermincola potens JR]